MKCQNFLLPVFAIIVLLSINCQRSLFPVSPFPANGTWQVVATTNEGFQDIYFFNNSTGWLVGNNGTIKKTVDGGASWIDQASGTTSRLLSVYFLDSNRGCIVGYDNTVLFTQNGGETWASVTVPSDTATIYDSIHADKNNNLYFITNHGEIFRSVNAGMDWELYYDFNEWGYSYVNFKNYPTIFAMQFHGDKLKRTNNGGNSWETFALPSNWTCCVYFINGYMGWMVEDWTPSSAIHDNTSMYVTVNGGETWKAISTLQGIAYIDLYFSDTLQGWLLSPDKIYYSYNTGKTWNEQFTFQGGGYLKDMFFIDQNTGWVLASQGEIFKYSNN